MMHCNDEEICVALWMAVDVIARCMPLLFDGMEQRTEGFTCASSPLATLALLLSPIAATSLTAHHALV